MTPHVKGFAFGSYLWLAPLLVDSLETLQTFWVAIAEVSTFMLFHSRLGVVFQAGYA